MDETKGFTHSGEKSVLRQSLLSLRAGVSDKLDRSVAIARRVLGLVHGNVMTYMSIGTEVDTNVLNCELLKRDDVTLYAPYTVNGMIVPGRLLKLGIPNRIGNLPIDCYEKKCNKQGIRLDYCLTPLLGFNKSGYRIGYGKGCYDRFFVDFATRKIGLAFGVQCAQFKEDRHDVPLDCCVTEEKVIYF